MLRAILADKVICHRLFLANFAYAVKEYFGLIRLPMLVVNFSRAYIQQAKVLKALVAGILVLFAGLVVQPALNYLDQGTLLDSCRSVAEYPYALPERQIFPQRTTWSCTVKRVFWRLEYVNWLLLNSGAAAALTLAAILLGCDKGTNVDQWQLVI